MNEIVLLVIFAAPPVICLLIIKLESDRFTLLTLGFGNSPKIPDFSRFNTLGTFTLNVDDVVWLAETVLLVHIPVTKEGAAFNVKVLPSTDIASTSLNTGSEWIPSLNDIIELVFMPAFPEKLPFTTVAAVPTTLIVSFKENPVNWRSYNTVSALKSVNNPLLSAFASWNTDFISSIV